MLINNCLHKTPMSSTEQTQGEKNGPIEATVDTESNPHTQAILSVISSSNIVLLDSLIAQTRSDPHAYPGPSRQTMLQYAAGSNQPLVLSHLLQMPPSSDVEQGLLLACALHIECYKALIALHPHALAYGLGHTGDVFGLAVCRGDLEFMRYAANEPSWNIDPNTSEVLHRPTLEWAAGNVDPSVVRCLLTECGPVRVRGTNVIKAALTRGRSDILECVLEHAQEGAKAVVDGWPLSEELDSWEAERRSAAGWDVPNLHYAATLGKHEAVRMLLEAGADPNLEDGRGRKFSDILPMDDVDVAAAQRGVEESKCRLCLI
ncbi:hypothetical protein DFH07DRAFT_835108, partial [Mycena maculata]